MNYTWVLIEKHKVALKIVTSTAAIVEKPTIANPVDIRAVPKLKTRSHLNK